LQLRRNKQHGKQEKRQEERNSGGDGLYCSASTAAPNTAPSAGQPGADLSIADLKNLATIIDVASTRGAFRANEMATVGVMFNKLSAFLARRWHQQTNRQNNQQRQRSCWKIGDYNDTTNDANGC
jgi:hypothetical protein